MKLLLISPSFFPATFWGGPIFSTLGLCDALAQFKHVQLRVVTTDSAGPQISNAVSVSGFPSAFPGGYPVYFCRRRFGSSGSPRLIAELFRMIYWADVVHLNAVYSMPTIPTLLLARFLGKPVVWSPRGAFLDWAKSSRSYEKSIWDIICNSIVKRSKVVLHLTSVDEAIASTAKISNAMSTVISNGVTVPAIEENRNWMEQGVLRVIFLGRLHPIKGLENLIQAIAGLKNFNVTLAIFGDGDSNYIRGLEQLVAELELVSRVTFYGHVEASEKATAFRNADVCVIPSYSENFGMVVAESLAHGVPVIVSKRTPWAEVESQGCGLWVQNTPDELAAALSTIRTKNLREMGKLGKAWMAREFAWSKVAEKMLSVYQNLNEGKCV